MMLPRSSRADQLKENRRAHLIQRQVAHLIDDQNLAAIANPYPDKTIRSISLDASEEGAVYVLLGLSLADRMPYYRASAVSYGGPDNWSGSLVLYALTQGLAGVKDEATRMQELTLSPRWAADDSVTRASVTLRYAASNGYTAYQYSIDRQQRVIRLRIAGNADLTRLRILLPAGARRINQARLGGHSVQVQTESVRASVYALLNSTPKPSELIEIEYR